MSLGIKAQMLAVKTNGLADVAMIPNIGVELATGNHTSLNASFYGSAWIYGKPWTMYFGMADFRYWPMSGPMDQLFIGVACAFGHYKSDALLANKYDGDALAFGMTFGWSWPLTRYHWTIEAQATVGGVLYNQNRQGIRDVGVPNTYNEKGIMFMPFQVGVNFAYILKYKNEVDSKRKQKFKH